MPEYILCMTGQVNAHSLEYLDSSYYLRRSLQSQLSDLQTLPYLAISYWVYTKPLLEDSPTGTGLISRPAPATEYN